MKKPRKLSLQEEMERELRQIEKELSEHPELDDIQVTEEMDAALLAKIRAYEKEKAEEESAKREIEENQRNRDVEFSEELVPDISVLAELSKKMTETASGNAVDAESASCGNLRNEEDTKPEEAAGDKKTVSYRRKKRKYLFASLVAMMVLVLGLGMTSVGSKSYLKELLDKALGKEPLQVINVEDMETIGTEDGDEITAYKEVEGNLGTNIVRIIYKPKEMSLLSYTVDKELLQARMFYKYNEQVIRYTMYVNASDSSWGEKEEDIKVGEYTVNVNNMQIKVEEFQAPLNNNVYRQIANFEYLGVHYQLKGIMEKEEFKKIIENLKFF